MHEQYVNIINEMLDQARTDLHLTSDEQLARRLDVSNNSIARWRNGQVNKSTKILLPLLVTQQQSQQEVPA